MKNKILLLITVATLGLTTATMAQVPSYVPTNGLVGYWPFNGNANDESGNGNNGTLNGATLTSDRFGNANSAYSFDGVDDYIGNTSNGFPFANTNRTINCWILNNNNFSGWSHTILSYGTASQGNAVMPAIGNNNVLTVQGWSDDFSSGVQSINYSWHMMTFSLDNGIGKIYYDGVQIATQSILQWNTIQSVFLIGVRIDIQNSFYFGKIDDIGIWNRVLTQQEITDLYNNCQLSVSTQPANQTININNTAQFIVGSSDTNATYQWQTDLGVGFQNLNSVGQYNGTANDTLSVANVTMSNHNQLFRCIINSGSCADTSNVAVLTINNNVGIHEIAQHNLFSVFPNPAHNIINVKADHKLIGSVFTIYDNTGKAVQSGKINAANTTIELSNLSGGVYLFSIGDNMKQTFKLIKE
jgi:hypothetical protein